MSVCGQTEEESASEEAGPREIYEQQKSASKVVRVLTVLAYLLSVSLAAILLSVYYVCVWKSPELPRVNESVVGPAAQRADPLHGNHSEPLHPGGGGVPINDSSSQPEAYIADGAGSPSTASEGPGAASAATVPQLPGAPHTTPAAYRTDAGHADNSSVT